MKTLFGGVYAPSTIGTLLREFTFGHARQLESVLREHLARLGARSLQEVVGRSELLEALSAGAAASAQAGAPPQLQVSYRTSFAGYARVVAGSLTGGRDVCCAEARRFAPALRLSPRAR